MLHPLPISPRPLQEVSMDLVSGLPESQEHDAILVIVDRLSKIRHFIPWDSMVAAEQAASLYFQQVWKLYGLPTEITDRGTRFTTRFSNSLCPQLKIGPECQQPTTQKLMEKQSESMRKGNNIYTTMSPTTSTTGYDGYSWPSSPQTTREPLPQKLTRLSLTTGSTHPSTQTSILPTPHLKPLMV